MIRPDQTQTLILFSIVLPGTIFWMVFHFKSFAKFILLLFLTWMFAKWEAKVDNSLIIRDFNMCIHNKTEMDQLPSDYKCGWCEECFKEVEDAENKRKEENTSCNNCGFCEECT